jgi:4-oxalocrotonate tautomerase
MPTASPRATSSTVERTLPESEGAVMPFVNVKVIEGTLTADEKQEMITRLTDTIVSIDGKGAREVTWVVIEEVASGEWGIGGQAQTTAEVMALKAANAAR